MSRKLAPALAIALLLVICLALAGCIGPKAAETGTIVNTAKENASSVTCATNRTQIANQLSTARSTSDETPPDVAAVVAELRVVCPSGGTYSLDQATSKVACSVHGE